MFHHLGPRKQRFRQLYFMHLFGFVNFSTSFYWNEHDFRCDINNFRFFCLFFIFLFFFIFLRFKSNVRVMYLIPNKVCFGIDFGAFNCTSVISCFIDFWYIALCFHLFIFAYSIVGVGFLPLP